MCERREKKKRERVNTCNIKKCKKKKKAVVRKKQKNIYEQKIHIWEMLKAQYNLANMYANGQGVWQEFTKARKCWKIKAAAKGDEDATKALKR